MLVWNDLVSDEKIRVYDKGVEGVDSLCAESKEKTYGLRLSYRSGDMWAPQVHQVEALKGETSYFIDCISNNISPKNDGYAGLRVVKILEAIRAGNPARVLRFIKENDNESAISESQSPV